MSNLERIFLWHPNCNVSMIARIKGNVSIEKLYDALDVVLKIHPLINAKIEFDEEYNAWFSTEEVPKPLIKTVQRISGTQWYEELQGEVQNPFNLKTGPLIKFILVHSAEVSDLIVICNHSICDGMSLVYLIKDLLLAYKNSEEETRTLYPPYNEDFLGDNRVFSLSSIFTRVLTYHANKQWEKNPYHFDYEDYITLQTAYWEKNSFESVLLELNPTETRELSKRCKENGVTIGSALTTACIRGYEEIIGQFTKGQKQVSIPFDLRRHSSTPIGDVFCFCVGSTRFSYEYQINKSFWENVAILDKEIHHRVEKLDSAGLKAPNFSPTLMDAFSCFAPLIEIVPDAYSRTENLEAFSKDKQNIAFKFTKRSKNMIPGTISSNLGALDIPESYDDLIIDRMIFLPAINDSIPLILGGISINDKMVFSLTYPQSKDDDNDKTEKMIQVRNKSLKYLGFRDNANKNAFE